MVGAPCGSGRRAPSGVLRPWESWAATSVRAPSGREAGGARAATPHAKAARPALAWRRTDDAGSSSAYVAWPAPAWCRGGCERGHGVRRDLFDDRLWLDSREGVRTKYGATPAPRTGRIREFGVDVGALPCGPLDKITDVPGVTVGHATLRGGDGPDAVNTGVTVVVPCEDDPFSRKLVAAAYVHNGFGKTCGTVQIEELGTLETPIALTNTLCVGRVADALVGHVLGRCEREGVEALSINPVVGECNDSRLNRIALRAAGAAEFERACAEATRDFEEGAVGAGAGTVCFGLKGGIGSASRIVEVGGHPYTIGVLVQSNFGATVDLVVDGRPLGRDVARMLAGEDALSSAGSSLLSDDDRGSIMTIVATDLPLDARQLRRLIRRAGVGIARTGGYTGHGSGEVMIGFTTANRVEPAEGGDRRPATGNALRHVTVLREELLDPAFKAVAEATHEAILTSMTAAGPARALNGATVHSLAEFF